MIHLIYIALGGAGGALCRYGATNLINHYVHGHFPVATLSVNCVGSFCMGVFYVLITEHMTLHPDLRSVFMVGFLGAFTTFSTFSLETVNLLEHGHLGTAFAYTMGSVLICVLAAWAAILLTRSIL